MFKSRKLIALGSAAIGILSILVVYLGLISLGIIQVAGVEILITTASIAETYDGTTYFAHEYSIDSGELTAGHYVEMVYTGSQTEIGESRNLATAKIYDATEKDVTKSYIITYNFGTLKVYPIEITVRSYSDAKVYDGTPLRNPNYEIVNNDLLPNHRLNVAVTGSITEVGQVENTINVDAFDNENRNVNRYYEFNLQPGILYVSSSLYSDGKILDDAMDYDGGTLLELYGNVENRHVYLRDKSFGEYNYQGFNEATPYPKQGEISPLNYVANALRFSEDYQSDEMTIRYTRDRVAHITPYYAAMPFEPSSDIKHQGAYSPEYSVDYFAYSYEKNGFLATEDGSSSDGKEYFEYVSSYYTRVPDDTELSFLSIASHNGLRSSSPTLIQDVQDYIRGAAAHDRTYRGHPDGVNDSALYFLETSRRGNASHFAAAATLMYRTLGVPARYTQGFDGQVIPGRWRPVSLINSHAWVEVYIENMGWVYIDAVPLEGQLFSEEPLHEIEIKPTKVTAKFDGHFHEPVSVDGFEGLSALGFTYVASFSGAKSTVGKGKTLITSFDVYNANGINVTGLLGIKEKPGDIHIYYEQLILTTASLSKVYDDQPLVTGSDEHTLVGDINPSHTINIFPTGYQKDKGTSANSMKVVISEGLLDVTEHYMITYNFGRLTVKTRPIHLITGSKTIPQKDAPATTNDYELEVIEGLYFPLVDGHILDLVCSGIQFTRGNSENLIQSIDIYHEGNSNLSLFLNYEVKTTFGILTVTRT